MSRRQKLVAVLLVVLLTAAAYGLFRTNQPAGPSTSSSDKNSNAQNSVVDQTPLTTAQRLALLNQNKNIETFYSIEDIRDDDNNIAGTRVFLKIDYKDLVEDVV